MSSGDGDEAKGDEAGLVNVFQPLQRGTNKVAPGPSSDDGDRYYGMTPAAARKRGKPKFGDADVAELDKAEQLKGEILPMPVIEDEAPRVITQEMKDFDAFHKVRMARADYRLFGIRQKNRLAKEQKE